MSEALSLASPSPQHGGHPLISVVVPVRNEAPNILPLIGEIRAALTGIPHEIVYVDDGSTDETPQRLRQALAEGAPLRIIRHKASCGQSAGVITGVKHARGTWIATLDGDGQNDPASIPEMLARAQTEERQGGGPILIAGWRQKRRDTSAKRYGSRIANKVRAAVLKDATPDTGCGLKVFRRDAFLEIPHFDHMHRFLPALFIRQGGRVISVAVNHRPRLEGQSNYNNWQRLKVGIVDLIGMYWLQRRWRGPQIDGPIIEPPLAAIERRSADASLDARSGAVELPGGLSP
ncbi:glycosyltransferase family 2 protein [Acidisoma sp. 7E03]